MITRIAEGSKTAYCPKFDRERTIWVKLFENTSLGDIKDYGWFHFNCPEQSICSYFNHRNDRCPFLSELLSCFARR